MGEKFEVNYDINLQKSTVILDKILSQINGKVVDDTYALTNDKLVITKGKSGLDVDKDELVYDLTQILIGRSDNGKATRYDITYVKKQKMQRLMKLKNHLYIKHTKMELILIKKN